MTTRKSEDKNIRKLCKIGKQSIGLTLPIEMLRELGWKSKQKVIATKVKGGIVIRDFKNK